MTLMMMMMKDAADHLTENKALCVRLHLQAASFLHFAGNDNIDFFNGGIEDDYECDVGSDEDEY